MTPRGVRNCNPGNIIRTPTQWLGKVSGGDDRFETFSAPAFGIRAIVKTLRTYDSRYGLRTVRDLVTRWAPPQENDTDAYVRSVAASTGFDPDDDLDLWDERVMMALLEAIILHENGEQPYDEETLRCGIILAGRW